MILTRHPYLIIIGSKFLLFGRFWNIQSTVPHSLSILVFRSRLSFLILFVLFVIAIEMNQLDSINAAEMAFLIYGLGFSLEKVAAMQEHGMQVYFKGTWVWFFRPVTPRSLLITRKNGFDLALVTTYLIYAVLRIYGVYHNGTLSLCRFHAVCSLAKIFGLAKQVSTVWPL